MVHIGAEQEAISAISTRLGAFEGILVADDNWKLLKRKLSELVYSVTDLGGGDRCQWETLHMLWRIPQTTHRMRVK